MYLPLLGHPKVIKATYVWTRRRGHRTTAAAASARAAASKRRGLPLGGEKCRAMEQNGFLYFKEYLFFRVYNGTKHPRSKIKEQNAGNNKYRFKHEGFKK